MNTSMSTPIEVLATANFFHFFNRAAYILKDFKQTLSFFEEISECFK